jgi:hypothetical protein
MPTETAAFLNAGMNWDLLKDACASTGSTSSLYTMIRFTQTLVRNLIFYTVITPATLLGYILTSLFPATHSADITKKLQEVKGLEEIVNGMKKVTATKPADLQAAVDAAADAKAEVDRVVEGLKKTQAAAGAIDPYLFQRAYDSIFANTGIYDGFLKANFDKFKNEYHILYMLVAFLADILYIPSQLIMVALTRTLGITNYAFNDMPGIV